MKNLADNIAIEALVVVLDSRQAETLGIPLCHEIWDGRLGEERHGSGDQYDSIAGRVEAKVPPPQLDLHVVKDRLSDVICLLVLIDVHILDEVLGGLKDLFEVGIIGLVVLSSFSRIGAAKQMHEVRQVIGKGKVPGEEQVLSLCSLVQHACEWVLHGLNETLEMVLVQIFKDLDTVGGARM